MNTDVMFSKKSDEWQTPQDLFDTLDVEFGGFDVDAAATRENAQCPGWFGPGGVHEDALAVADWGRADCPATVWLNPPYSRCREFIAKAAEQGLRGNTVVCLVPSRTDTRWWHDYVWDREKHQTRPGVEVRFLKGRLRFVGAGNCAPFPSVIIIFRPVNS